QLAKIPELNVLRLQLKGDFLIKSAWEARGVGFIDTVTPEGAKLFHQRPAEARSVLKKAWDLKPDESRTATLMLSVELGIGGGNRDQMEMWFERAMKADGNNRDACHAKMAWLEP